jgi:hypothetical protein
MYMCKQIKKENIVTMYDERVAELEHLLEKAHADHAGVMRMYENANARYLDDTNILAGILHRVFEDYGLEAYHLNDAINNLAFSNEKIISVLQFHEAVPSDLLEREYEVSMTIPVTITVKVTAGSEDQAEEIAADEVECNGVDCYYMDYDLTYGVDYEVNEV